MNRRFRAAELSLGEVAASIAPYRPHVSPQRAVPPSAQMGDESVEVPPFASAGSPTSSDRDSRWTRPEATSGGPSNPNHKGGGEDSVEETGLPGGADYYRRRALDALHTYVWNECGNDYRLATPIFNRVVSALEQNLGRKVRAEQGNR